MDTATHTHRRRIALVLVLAAAATTFGGQRSAPAREPMVIHGANAAEERVIDWSLRRYREAGLDGMPDLEIYLHRSHEGCRDGIGYYLAGRIDLCTTASSEPYQRKFALHEMAHGWIETNVDGAVLDRFAAAAAEAAADVAPCSDEPAADAADDPAPVDEAAADAASPAAAADEEDAPAAEAAADAAFPAAAAEAADAPEAADAEPADDVAKI